MEALGHNRTEKDYKHVPYINHNLEQKLILELYRNEKNTLTKNCKPFTAEKWSTYDNHA